MRKIEIEAWVLRIADAVTAGQHIEDSRVELKAKWPDDAARAARRIAGHLNASRGDDVLWVIGLDEASGIVGAPASDTAAWWGAVQSHFDEHTPILVDVVVQVGQGLTVVALHFSAEAVPVVVRNPAFGAAGGGAVEREVPWRDGTSVRSARRSDLLRMLVPRTATPRVEILSARVNASIERPRSDDGDLHVEWQVNVSAYMECPLGTSVVIPWHRASVTFLIPTCRVEAVGKNVRITGHSPSTAESSPFAPRIDVATIHTGHEQVLIEGPGTMQVSCYAITSVPSEASLPMLEGETGVLRIEWLAVDADQPQKLALDMAWRVAPEDQGPDQEWRGRWRYA